MQNKVYNYISDKESFTNFCEDCKNKDFLDLINSNSENLSASLMVHDDEESLPFIALKLSYLRF